jgi:hypothetical protein
MTAPRRRGHGGTRTWPQGASAGKGWAAASMEAISIVQKYERQPPWRPRCWALTLEQLQSSRKTVTGYQPANLKSP